MPQVFKIGAYLVYFWLNEGMPLEPIHVHIAEGTPVQNGTKIWITQKGRMHRRYPSANCVLLWMLSKQDIKKLRNCG